MNVKRVVRSMAVMVLVAGGVGASSVVSASADAPPQYFVDETKLPFGAIPGLATNRYWGVQGGGSFACPEQDDPTVKECTAGAGYRIEVPENWNGKLVMWAHGFAGTGLELFVQNHPLRGFLIANGYAWAASSYSRNDYDVEAGVQDTHALTQLFNGIVGHPSRVYLTGASMGGHITAASIEQYRNEYDGAMPICGVLGDHELFDYYLDFNLVAAALAGVPTTFPPDPSVWLSQSVPQIKATLGSPWPSTLTQDGQHLKDLTELRSGGDRPLFDEAWLFWDDFLFQFGALDGTVPRSPGVVVDNTDAVYQFDTDPALSPAEQALNDSVLRVAQTPAGRVEHGMTNVPVVNGTPDVPVLTLHDIGDFFVPFSMEQIYANRVAAAGRSDLLVQRAIRGVGHCDFTGPELVRGFLDLVNWVEHGVRPMGDNVTDPSVVADPNYGCKFTIGQHQFAPACT